MPKHYSPKTFFRMTPNRVLQEFFASRGLLETLNWGIISERKIEPIFSAFQVIPQNVKNEIETLFSKITI